MFRSTPTIIALVLFLLLWSGVAFPLRGEEAQLSENQVMAAYLFNFAKFVEWPSSAFPSAAAPIVIGLFGRGLGAEAQEALSGRRVQGRRIQIRVCSRIEDIAGCQILYIAALERARLKDILRAAPPGVLTVSDLRHFCAMGGMIGLVPRGEKLLFEISIRNAERAGLKLSSHLLRLAVAVYD